jgi:tripartite-type tricarboxylate transporter receptor subunit TctC
MKNATRRAHVTTLSALVMAAALPFGTTRAQAQPGAETYPARPVTLVVGFAPGGGSDAVARVLAQALGTKLGQQVIVDNKPGANTILATQYVRSRPADGYTLLFTSASFAINPSLQKLNFDIDKDFAPIALVDTVPLLLVTNNDVPAKSVQELVALAKSQPKKLNYASFGSGSAGHLATELLLQMTGTDMVHVPYKGSGPALVDVMGGQVAMMMPGIGSAVNLAKEGKVRALAVSSAKRSSSMPEVPTIAESGVPGFELVTWEAILAPAGTPPAVQSRLNAALREVVAAPAVREQLVKLGVEPDATKTPAEVGSFIRSEADRFGKLIRSRNIKGE